MFTEELNVIRNAEERADSMKKESKQEAKKMVEKAKAEAAEILLQAELSAKDRYETLNSEGQKLADAEYEATIQQAESEAERLGQQAAAKKAEVVQFIAERIVNLSVNC